MGTSEQLEAVAEKTRENKVLAHRVADFECEQRELRIQPVTSSSFDRPFISLRC
jgi:hypothetical protein